MRVVWVAQCEEVGRHVLICELYRDVLFLEIDKSDDTGLVRGHSHCLAARIVDDGCIVG